MTSRLVDTSAAIAFLRGDERVRDAIVTANRLVWTPVVVAELLLGVQRLQRRAERERVLAWLAHPGTTQVPVTRATAERYAAIAAYLRAEGRPMPTNDIWIAASAMEHGLVVVTLDAHFATLPQILVAPLA